MPYYTKLVYYDAATGTEVHYACLDTTRANALIDWAVGFGIPVPAWLYKMFTWTLFMFSVDGVAVFSNQASLSTTMESNIGSAITAKLPNYVFSKNTAKFTC